MSAVTVQLFRDMNIQCSYLMFRHEKKIMNKYINALENQR